MLAELCVKYNPGFSKGYYRKAVALEAQNQMLDALETDYKLNVGKALPQCKAHMKPIQAYFGSLKAIKVTAKMIDKYIESRLAEKKHGSTINRETALLRHAFRLAIENKDLSTAPKIRRSGIC